MDWNLFWVAAGCVISLAAIIIGCFVSLSNDIRSLSERLSHLEGYIAGRDVGKNKEPRRNGTET